MAATEGIYKVAAVQMDSGSDLHENLDHAAHYVAEAAAAGATIICFPEHMPYISTQLQDIDLEYMTRSVVGTCADLARTYGIWLHCGSMYEWIPGSEKPANTSFVFSPAGKIVSTYRKMHLFDVTLPDGTTIGESDEVVAGREPTVFHTPFDTWGSTICYDLRFPEQFRALAIAGANVIAVPADFTEATGRAHWEVLLRARAIENGVYIVAPDQCGRKPDFQAYGHTMIIDPWGTVLARSDGETSQIVYADINISYLNEVRDKIPVLRNCSSQI